MFKIKTADDRKFVILYWLYTALYFLALIGAFVIYTVMLNRAEDGVPPIVTAFFMIVGFLFGAGYLYFFFQNGTRFKVANASRKDAKIPGALAGFYKFKDDCHTIKNGQRSGPWTLRFAPDGIHFSNGFIRYSDIRQIRKYRDVKAWMFFVSKRINPPGKQNDGVTYPCSPYSAAILRHNTNVEWEEEVYPLPPPLQVTSKESETIIGVNTKLKRAKTILITIFLITTVSALAILTWFVGQGNETPIPFLAALFIVNLTALVALPSSVFRGALKYKYAFYYDRLVVGDGRKTHYISWVNVEAITFTNLQITIGYVLPFNVPVKEIIVTVDNEPQFLQTLHRYNDTYNLQLPIRK